MAAMTTEATSNQVPLISVLMPAYNSEAFVGEAVASILAQTFTDFELLVIDDGSTDSTRDVLEAIRDPRLRLVSNPHNMGLIRTLNRGLELATGHYVARMDADDVSAPERLERQVEFLESHPDVDVLGTMVNLINEDGKQFGAIRGYPTDPKAIHRFLLRECCLIHPSVMFRKNVVLAAGGYLPAARHAEDYDLWLRLSDHHEIANLAEQLVSYRMHRNQVSIKNLPTQHAVAQSCRRAALQRRRALGEDVRDVEPVIEAGVWRRLTAAECTLGSDYLNWARIYRWMNHPDMGLRLARKALRSSPLSVGAWGTLVRCAAESIIPPSWRLTGRWYLARLGRLLSSRKRLS